MSKSEYPLSDEHKAAISKTMTGRKRPEFSDEHKAKIAAAVTGDKNGMYKKEHTEESRRKMSERATGRTYDADVVAKRAEKLRGKVRERMVCPYCGKDVASNIYKQWHGEKCKMKP